MSVLDTACWACSLPPMFCQGTPVPLCTSCRNYVGNPLAGVRITTLTLEQSRAERELHKSPRSMASAATERR